MSFFESLIRYIFNATDRVRVDELKEMVEKTITKDKEEIIMTLAEKLIQQGMQQGIQQGVQQGVQQGMQQGLQQGMQEGEIKMARKAVLDVLETRFQEIPASLKVKLEGVSDRAFLEDLLRQAVTVASPDELEKKIPLGNLS